MIIPIKKSAWEHQGSKGYTRSITAAGYTGTQYRIEGSYWVCFDGTTSPYYPREYQAASWFLDRVKKLLEVA